MKFLKQSWVIPVLLIAILVAVVINIAITLDINENNDKGSNDMQEKESHGWWFFNDKEENDTEDNTAIAEYNPTINPSDFSSVINNPYYTLTPETNFVYKGTKDGSFQTNNILVTKDTKMIMGVKTIVVNDRVLDENSNLIEETFDWYAQDKDGNVWYFGEDAKDYENGKVVSTEGSWEAGKDGAKAGIIMKANPQIKDSWRQEYMKGVAEDMAEILGIHESIKTQYGSYNDCIKTKDWTPLSPNVIENKYYCKNTGVVLMETVEGGQEKMEMSSVKKP